MHPPISSPPHSTRARAPEISEPEDAPPPPLPAGVVSFVEHRGHRIACMSHVNPEADRLPVVWVHGLTASFRFWEAAMYAEVRQRRSWYSVSLPLHHPSTFRAEPDVDLLSEQLFAELLAKPIEALIPEGKFHLVGYSLGGFACLNYAAKFGERVASIISIGGFMTGRARGLEGVLQFLSGGRIIRPAIFRASWWIMQRHVVFLKLATLFYARRRRALLNYPALNATLRLIFQDVRRHDIEGQRALFRYLLEMDLMDELEALTHPVLVIAGDKDPIIPFGHQQECAQQLVNGELAVLPGVGHVPFAEAAGEFRGLVLGWLDKWG